MALSPRSSPGPVSMDPLDWICPLLGVDADAFNHGGTPEFAAISPPRGSAQRYQPLPLDHPGSVRADAPMQAQWRHRSTSVVPGILRRHAARMSDWAPLLDTSDVNHGLLLPILLHCRDDQGHPLLGPARTGRATKDFLRNAHADIPAVVESLRQYWMPTRYARAG